MDSVLVTMVPETGEVKLPVEFTTTLPVTVRPAAAAVLYVNVPFTVKGPEVNPVALRVTVFPAWMVTGVGLVGTVEVFTQLVPFQVCHCVWGGLVQLPVLLDR